jgi:hypothetical protein
MKKNIYEVLGLIVLFGVLFALGGTQEASAQVQVNINIMPPPPLQFAAPPDVVVIPSGISYVYMVPNYYGVYFYDGYWYRFYRGYWFRSSIYNGYWGYIEPSIVPQCIIAIPPEYIYYVPSGYYRIHYHDLHRNWRTWDEGHHWNRYDWYKHEMRDDIRRERYSQIERGSKHHDVPKPQQHGAPKPQHYNNQKHQPHDVQKPQRHDVPEPQKHDAQKPQHRDVPTPQQNGVHKPQHHDEQDH